MSRTRAVEMRRRGQQAPTRGRGVPTLLSPPIVRRDLGRAVAPLEPGPSSALRFGGSGPYIVKF
jgi:hypothetical protein